MEADLRYEKNRLETFKAHWSVPYISSRVLAKTGFFYKGPHDNVKCHFCKVEISSWKLEDNEVKKHQNRNRYCPLLKQNTTSNVPSEPISELTQLLSECILKFPEFEEKKARLQSYKNWPKNLKQEPEQLSEAGFFYTQRRDRVICFDCGGGTI